ncbi:hypothetical protein HU200_038428 [Digitaria exilis]|uniref:Uncharacterized protein n=1 Tax=Digitaria exilis TaxID=1010633 RepID=A0A835BD17_9POAL|nr:hypothetical protein HU200_038428 [Digitaria exilis]
MDHASSGLPRKIPYHLLEEITGGFSDVHKLGSVAYGEVFMVRLSPPSPPPPPPTSPLTQKQLVKTTTHYTMKRLFTLLLYTKLSAGQWGNGDNFH